jgi:DNA excision repair protein ERCC-2
MTEPQFADILFPFENVREEQDRLIQAVTKAVTEKRHLVVHAPTGLGKTIATLGPCLKYAIDNGKTVFFLTSRHTQHVIAIDTLRAIKEKFGIEFSATDVIGKKNMCIFPGTERTGSAEFMELCRQLRDEDKCEFYLNFKKGNKVSVRARALSDELGRGISHTEKVIEACAGEKLCPYEIAAFMGRDAKVIVGDYYYIFNPNVRNSFFRRTGKELENCIVIADEAHNLPSRLRELMSVHVSSFMMKRAVSEAKKFHHDGVMSYLVAMQEILNGLAGDLKAERSEKKVEKEDFMRGMAKLGNYDEIVEEMVFAAEQIRDRQRYSFVGGVARFLDAWQGGDDGFTRIISVGRGKDEPFVMLRYDCLDPSIVTKEAIAACHSIICMSGTLTPVGMYADLLGFDTRTDTAEFRSPFPKKNVLRLVVPETTTRFSMRTGEQFEKIGRACAEIANAVPGNVALFFPSYQLRDTIAKIFTAHCGKKAYYESPGMDKAKRNEMLEKFKREGESGRDESVKGGGGKGAVLLAAATGSFGEGIDYPGDFLKGVVIVGLPLNPPDIETKSLIEYYNRKYGKGWDYGYIIPAITKCMQGAGRCIRSETDRGIIVFLDERFAWPSYYGCFPPDYGLRVTKDYVNEIRGFFSG